MNTKHAFIVVDVQKDFVEGGALAVEGGAHVAKMLAEVISNDWDSSLVLYTTDWHIDPGDHFSDDPDYVDSWPPHCRAFSEGATLAEEFEDPTKIFLENRLFFKGLFSASYSGAEATNGDGTSLVQHLKDRGILSVTVVGLAYDYCVSQTAKDLAEVGFPVTVLKRLTASVHPEREDEVDDMLENLGVLVMPR